jgi:hypothetical protein
VVQWYGNAICKNMGDHGEQETYIINLLIYVSTTIVC